MIFRLLLLLCAASFTLTCAARTATAHPLANSSLQLRLADVGIEALVEAHLADLDPAFVGVNGAGLTPARLELHRDAIVAILRDRCVLSLDGSPLAAEVTTLELSPEGTDVRAHLHYAVKRPPAEIGIDCLLGSDPVHRTYVDIYENGTLAHQAVLSQSASSLDYQLGAGQETLSVVRRFIAEGVHHIFIGPDHLLFVVGLLLLPASLLQLLKIVSAFTIAHSITLALATLGILNPPAGIIEPAIAASIVFVGVHALLNRGTRDARLLFAFAFGLVHGFGFAYALRSLGLPSNALAWSLFSFNVGVELGQACIVVLIAPLLARARIRGGVKATRLISALGGAAVAAMGCVWLVERIVKGEG